MKNSPVSFSFYKPYIQTPVYQLPDYNVTWLLMFHFSFSALHCIFAGLRSLALADNNPALEQRLISTSFILVGHLFRLRQEQ